MTYQLKVSTNNKKLHYIPSISFPPVLTCRAGAPCAKDCYAVKMCSRYAFKAMSAYQYNYEFYKNDPENFFNQLKAYFTIYNSFRVNVAGDIPSYDFLERLCNIAFECSNCDIILFTKQFEIVNDYINDYGKPPKNLHIIYSNWYMFKCFNPYNLPVCEVVNSLDEIAPDKDNYICCGDCTACAQHKEGCFNNSLKTLYIKKH